MTNVNAYMVEALINSLVDEGYTPHLLVSPSLSETPCVLPPVLQDEESFILNISVDAVINYHMDKEKGILSFEAKFSGNNHQIMLPCETIWAVKSSENEYVLSCMYNRIDIGKEGTPSNSTPPEEPKRPTLTVVK